VPPPPAVTPPPPAPPAEPATPLLSHAVVDRVASDHSRELSKCDGGEELHGEITVKFAVDASGKVTKAQVATGIKKPKVVACILRLVQGWRFPKQGPVGAQGTYTLSFQ
jgi:TonB family protein